jgi:hypothetical protein
MQGWIPRLERKLEIAAETAHSDFRCFFSAEPINGAPHVSCYCAAQPNIDGCYLPSERHIQLHVVGVIHVLLVSGSNAAHIFTLSENKSLSCSCCVFVHPQAKIVPESILQTCIKISNEPPSDMKSNMRSVSATAGTDCNETHHLCLMDAQCLSGAATQNELPAADWLAQLVKLAFFQTAGTGCIQPRG